MKVRAKVLGKTRYRCPKVSSGVLQKLVIFNPSARLVTKTGCEITVEPRSGHPKRNPSTPSGGSGSEKKNPWA